jgi:hypothetical protein
MWTSEIRARYPEFLSLLNMYLYKLENLPICSWIFFLQKQETGFNNMRFAHFCSYLIDLNWLELTYNWMTSWEMVNLLSVDRLVGKTSILLVFKHMISDYFRVRVPNVELLDWLIVFWFGLFLCFNMGKLESVTNLVYCIFGINTKFCRLFREDISGV